MLKDSSQINDNINNLNQLSNELKETVNLFKI